MPIYTPGKVVLAKQFTQQNYMWEFPAQYGLWSPANITTALWLDAADASTVTADGSNLVSQVNDKSGNGRSFTASGSARPTYSANTLNGMAVFTFGGSQRLTSASTAATWNFMHNATGSTIWIVAKAGNTSNPLSTYGYIGTNGGSSAKIGRSLYYYDDASTNNSINDFITRGTAGAVSNNSQNNQITPAETYIISAAGDPANATASARSSVRINGNSPIAANTFTNSFVTSTASHTLQVGDLGDSSFPLLGFISELVIQPGVPTTSTVQLVEGYLAHKWGLTANLPSTHPYKTVGPTP